MTSPAQDLGPDMESRWQRSAQCAAACARRGDEAWDRGGRYVAELLWAATGMAYGWAVDGEDEDDE